MKIKDIAPLLSLTSKIAIYEAIGEDIEAIFPDLYIGQADEIPPELMKYDISGVGVYDRGILEIQVRNKW